MKQYVVTEEEFMSLIESIRLERFEIFDGSPRKFIAADGTPDAAAMHKAFHYRVVSWVQRMGFAGHRGAQ